MGLSRGFAKRQQTLPQNLRYLGLRFNGSVSVKRRCKHRSTSVKTKPRFPVIIPKSHRTFNATKSSNAKAWVVKAIAEEGKNPPDRMWKKEPSAETISDEQLKRIRFLRKHGKTDPTLILIADCLDQCEKRNRCYSGATLSLPSDTVRCGQTLN